jgi:N-acetylmuramoyl-L-alanine amidase
MRFDPRTAFGAVFSIATAAALMGAAGGSSVTASDLPDNDVPALAKTDLLPQSVIDAAVAEEKAIPQRIELPATAEEAEARATQPKASSLAELVARRGATSIQGVDAECLAVAVYFESKSEPLIGQLAVAEVVLNRTRSGRFPSSACGVVRQSGQFSFVRGGGFPAIPRNSQDWREAVAIAKIAQNKEWSSGVGKALFFHASRVSPGWRLTRVAAVGNHIFYR